MRCETTFSDGILMQTMLGVEGDWQELPVYLINMNIFVFLIKTTF